MKLGLIVVASVAVIVAGCSSSPRAHTAHTLAFAVPVPPQDAPAPQVIEVPEVTIVAKVPHKVAAPAHPVAAKAPPEFVCGDYHAMGRVTQVTNAKFHNQVPGVSRVRDCHWQ